MKMMTCMLAVLKGFSVPSSKPSEEEITIENSILVVFNVVCWTLRFVTMQTCLEFFLAPFCLPTVFPLLL